MSRAKGPGNWRLLRDVLRDELRRLGATLDRQRGSHQLWRFADGEVFVVVGNHLSGAVDANILVRFRRLRARREPVAPGSLPAPGQPFAACPAPRVTGVRHMSKGNSGGGKGGSHGGKGGGGGGPKGGGGSGGKGGGGQIANLPSTTGHPSGGGRGNAPPR